MQLFSIQRSTGYWKVPLWSFKELKNYISLKIDNKCINILNSYLSCLYFIIRVNNSTANHTLSWSSGNSDDAKLHSAGLILRMELEQQLCHTIEEYKNSHKIHAFYVLIQNYYFSTCLFIFKLLKPYQMGCTDSYVLS